MLFSQQVKTANPILNPYLWFIHPRHINLHVAVRALEGVRRINGDVVEGVEQGDESWFALVELANLFKRQLLKPSRQRAHVQELFTVRREVFLHLCSCHHNDKNKQDRLIYSGDNHYEIVPFPIHGAFNPFERSSCCVDFTSSVLHTVPGILCKFLSCSHYQ